MELHAAFHNRDQLLGTSRKTDGRELPTPHVNMYSLDGPHTNNNAEGWHSKIRTQKHTQRKYRKKKFRRIGTFVLFVRRNGIRQNGVRQNGLTGQHGILFYITQGECAREYVTVDNSVRLR